MYEIKKEIPIPKRERKGHSTNYPFQHMEIGDCFDIPSITTVKATNATTYWRKKLKHRYTVKALDGGARIWRIA